MAKSNDKTHQTKGQELSYFWLGIGVFKWGKWWILCIIQTFMYYDKTIIVTNDFAKKIA